MSLNRSNGKNKILKLEILHSNGSKLEGNVLAGLNADDVTFSLSGIVHDVESKDTYYLSSAKGIRSKEVMKFTLFSSDGGIAEDYILKNNSDFYYGCCYDGKRDVNYNELVGLRKTEINEDEKTVIEEIREWFRNHGKAINNSAAYIEFVNKSNIAHHEFPDSIFKAAIEYFCKRFIVDEGNRRLNVEKELLENLVMSIIYGNEENLEAGKEAFAKSNMCIDAYIECMTKSELSPVETDRLFVNLAEKEVAKRELNSLRESVELSTDAYEYCSKFARIQTQYNIDAELLKIVLWYFNKNCDREETRGIIEQALSIDKVDYAFRNELLGQSLFVSYDNININDERINIEILELIKKQIKHCFANFERKVIKASDNLEKDKVESLKTLLLLQMVAYLTVIKCLSFKVDEEEIGAIVKDTQVSIHRVVDIDKERNTKNISEVGKVYIENRISLNTEVIGYLDSIIEEALKLSSDYLEAKKKYVKSE